MRPSGSSPGDRVPGRRAAHLERTGLVRLADLRRRQGRVAEAQELLRRAAGNALTPVVMAELALDLGDASAARDLLEPVLRRVPTQNRSLRAAPLEVMVRAKVAAGEAEAAASHLAELRSIADAVGTRPLRASVSLSEGLVAAAAGDQETARARLEDAVELFAASGAAFELARARLELARVLASLGREDAAAREATLALKRLDEIGAAAEAARARELLGSLGAPPGPGGRRPAISSSLLASSRSCAWSRRDSRTARSRRGSCSASTPSTATFRTPTPGWVARRGQRRWRRRTGCTCCRALRAWPHGLNRPCAKVGSIRRRHRLPARRYSTASSSKERSRCRPPRAATPHAENGKAGGMEPARPGTCWPDRPRSSSGSSSSRGSGSRAAGGCSRRSATAAALAPWTSGAACSDGCGC